MYGAYGKTGALIGKVAVERGHDVVLSGNDPDRLNRLAAELGVRGVAARLDQQTALRQLIRSAACVIHVAGPFATTFHPMLEACSAESVPYLDLNGELDVFRAIEAFVDRRPPTIPVLSGVGFVVQSWRTDSTSGSGLAAGHSPQHSQAESRPSSACPSENCGQCAEAQAFQL